MYKNKLNKIGNLIDSIKNDITLPVVSEFLEWFYEKIDLHFNKKIKNLKINKGDLFFVNLGQNIGSELNKQRPCVVISDYFYNKGNTVIIIPLKTYKGRKNKNTQILLKYNGLKNISLIDILSIRQIDKKRLNNFIGRINEKDILKINKKLKKIFLIK